MKKPTTWLLKLPILLLILLFLWFTPWVFVLQLGTLIYFPYAANGKDRFISITGPIPGLFLNTWAYSQNIPQFCRQALIAAEDEKFYEHHGIDWQSIEKSMQTNKKYKKMKRGGSTITQQLVKNAFLSRHKSYLRKAREIEGALLLNLIMPKESQLNWYFNVIEFGPNIYGIENAARFYFKKDAKNLTPSQCLALVTIIPAPKKWNRSLVKKNLTNFFIRRYNTILNNLKDMDIAKSKDVYSAAQMHLWSHAPVAQALLPSLPPKNTSSDLLGDSSNNLSNDESEKDMDEQENNDE